MEWLTAAGTTCGTTTGATTGACTTGTGAIYPGFAETAAMISEIENCNTKTKHMRRERILQIGVVENATSF